MKKFSLFSFLFLLMLNTAFGQTYTGAGGPIPDAGPIVNFPITVTGVPLTSGVVEVVLNFTHPRGADLDIFLQGPDGTNLELSTDNGAGANFTGTRLIMTAPQFIYAGASPFSAPAGYKPEGCGGYNAINFANPDPNGVWTLRVQDDLAGQVGTLDSWSIIFAPTNKNQMPSDNCANAPLVCSFDSYQGITYPPNPITVPAGFGPATICYSPDPGTGGPSTFCGSVENNSWLQFIASDATVILNVSVTNCSSPSNGIQFALYNVTNCASTTGMTYAGSGTPCYGNVTGTSNVTFNGLTPGNTYYLMIDGFAGNICNYSVNPISGVSGTAVTTSLPAGTSSCPGQPVTLTANATGATSFTWTSDPPGFSATGPSVTVSPTTTTTYFVNAFIGSGPCVGNQTASTVVTVYNPQVNASTTLLPCSGGSSTLTITNLPPTGGYDVSTPSYVPEAHAGTNVALGDDANSAALPIGFTFNFFGTNYTTFFIGSNGFITFGAGSTSLTPQTLPNTGAPNNIIALAWRDLDPGSNGNLIRYQTLGTAPNRRLVVSFQNVPYFASSLTVTGQIVLYETTNVIDIICINIDDTGAAKTMGIENASGTVGYPAPGRNNSVWGCAANTTRFTPQSNNITWSTGATNVPSITVSAPGTYSATVNGCLSNLVTVNIDAPFDTDLDNDGVLDSTDPSIAVSNCNFNINATPTDGITTGATISWSSTDPNFTAPAAGVYNYTARPVQCASYTFTATITRSGCTLTRTITVTCPGASPFSTDLDGNGSVDLPDQTLLTCATLNFNATLSPAAPNANTTTSYVWTSNDPSFTDPGNTPLYNGAVSPYWYQVVITRGNCPPITRRFTLFCAVCNPPGILLGNLPPFNAATNTTTINTCSASNPALTWDATVTNCGTGAAGSGTVDCSGGVTYTWTHDGTDVTPAVNPHIFSATAPGTYELTVVTGSCIRTRTFIVIGNRPIVNMPDVESCESSVLDATPANFFASSTYTYTWYYSPTYSGTYTMIGTPSTTPTLTIGIGAGFQGTGFYAVKVQRDDFTPACTAYDTIQFSLGEAPQIAASLQGATFTSCSPITLNLNDYITNFNASNTYTYNLVGSVSGTITASPTNPAVFTLPTATAVTSETYTVTITRGQYCSTTANFTFATDPPLLPALANITSCSPTSVNATVSNPQAGDVYSWTGPGGFTSSSPIVTISAPGTYIVTVSRGTLTNCNRNRSFTFTVPAPPVVNTQLEYIACDPVTVNADPTNLNSVTTVYTWTNLATGAVNPSTGNTAILTPGHYSVRASNGPLCNTTRNFYVTCPALSLSAIYNEEADLVNVIWTDTSNIEIGFELQRTDDVDNGAWETVAYQGGGFVFPANWLTYADAQIVKNKRYCYRVRYILPSFAGSPNPNYSSFSNIACIIVPKGDAPGEGLPPYEYKLRGVAGNQTATLYWQVADPAYGFQFYDVYMGIAPHEPTVRIGTTEKFQFTVPGLLNGREYTFKVRARYRASNDPYYFSETLTLRPSIILGEEDLNKPFSFELYPNPNNGEFEVKLSGRPSDKLTISMVNVAGQVLMTKVIDGFGGNYQEVLQFNDLPSGLYFLQIATGNETLQKKVSIVR